MSETTTYHCDFNYCPETSEGSALPHSWATVIAGDDRRGVPQAWHFCAVHSPMLAYVHGAMTAGPPASWHRRPAWEAATHEAAGVITALDWNSLSGKRTDESVLVSSLVHALDYSESLILDAVTMADDLRLVAVGSIYGVQRVQSAGLL